MRLNNIILKPILTEKTMQAGDSAIYMFKVNKKATKGTIKREIERLFKVDVINVRTMIMPGKRRRIPRKNSFTKTQNWKKAVVQLKPGQKISLVEESNN